MVYEKRREGERKEDPPKKTREVGVFKKQGSGVPIVDQQ